MIRDFWVENYLSIRERQGIDFVAKSGNEFLNVEIAPGVFLNKLGILYGANASGKTNILKAFTCAILMIRNSNFMNATGKWFSIKPFLFDKKNLRQCANPR